MTTAIGRRRASERNHDVVYQYARKDENSIEITDPYSQPVLRDEFGRAPLAAVKRDPIPRKTTSKVNRGLGQHHQVIAGIPDTSEFESDAISINISFKNVVPRKRSSISLIHCKSHCLHSQTGVYTCRSFVYDNINQVFGLHDEQPVNNHHSIFDDCIYHYNNFYFHFPFYLYFFLHIPTHNHIYNIIVHNH
ncbi:unnamed protein product [Nippostrongylus brasiliensis]|uniref:Uncharacterized protein n=1 Tax=Nippostrongylus brasiliensis TaxID=27835 RepID=A0A0N4Y2Y0_NIPBR|nr:unnamed protein product [Nippostrongylus brasiliensis]